MARNSKESLSIKYITTLIIFLIKVQRINNGVISNKRIGRINYCLAAIFYIIYVIRIMADKRQLIEILGTNNRFGISL